MRSGFEGSQSPVLGHCSPSTRRRARWQKLPTPGMWDDEPWRLNLRELQPTRCGLRTDHRHRLFTSASQGVTWTPVEDEATRFVQGHCAMSVGYLQVDRQM